MVQGFAYSEGSPVALRDPLLDPAAAVGHLGVDEVVRPEPVTMSELRATDPKLLYWFEGHGLRRR